MYNPLRTKKWIDRNPPPKGFTAAHNIAWDKAKLDEFHKDGSFGWFVTVDGTNIHIDTAVHSASLRHSRAKVETHIKNEASWTAMWGYLRAVAARPTPEQFGGPTVAKHMAAYPKGFPGCSVVPESEIEIFTAFIGAQAELTSRAPGYVLDEVDFQKLHWRWDSLKAWLARYEKAVLSHLNRAGHGVTP